MESRANHSAFLTRVQAVFTSIFSYHFTRPPVFSARQTPFGPYASMTFKKAESTPFAQLLKEGLIAEPTKVEILIKNSIDQKIDDIDLESVIMSVREEPDTLVILATNGTVPPDDMQRLFRVFTRYQAVILPLGENDIQQLENFIEHGNINACLIVLFMLADRITSENDALRGVLLTRAQLQERAIRARLDRLGALYAPQLRTLIKKLSFLMSYEESGYEISRACASVHISRKTFYLWREKDPAFKELLCIPWNT